MENRKKNAAALGALVVVASALFVWGLFYLMGDPVFKGGMEVVTAMDDAAGLKRGDRVQLHGVEVGSVRGVELRPDGRVAVRLRLSERLELPADTRVAVQGDVFGANLVTLLPGQALVRLEEGDTLRGEAAAALPTLVSDLSDRTRTLLTRADSLLSPAAVSDVHQTAAVLPASARELQAAFGELRLAAAALRRTAESVETAEAGPQLASTLQQLEGSARSFTAAADAMELSMVSLSSVIGKIDGGQGTLGRLVNDSTLYADLQGAAREVRALAADIRERPKRYVSIEVF